MTKKIVITCDSCKANIVGTPGMPINDHIVVTTGHSPTEPSNITFDLAQYPKLQADVHLCNLVCLKDWTDANCPEDCPEG